MPKGLETHYSRKSFSPDSYRGMLVLPEINEIHQRLTGNPIATVDDEVNLLNKAKSKLSPFLSGQGTHLSLAAQRAFDEYDVMATKAYVKNVAAFQERPDNEKIQNTLIHTMLGHHGVPLSSLFRDEDGWNHIPFPSGLVNPESDIKSINWNPENIAYQTVNSKSGKTSWSYGSRASSKSHLFFNNLNDFQNTMGSVAEVADVHTLTLPDLLEFHNKLIEGDQIPAEMLPNGWSKDLFPLLAKYEEVEMGDNRRGLALVLDAASLFTKIANGDLDPSKFAEEKQLPSGETVGRAIPKNRESLDLFWKDRLGDNATAGGIRNYLLTNIYNAWFGDGGLINEEEQEKISQVLGAAQFFYGNQGGSRPSNISIDESSGKAILKGSSPLNVLDLEKIKSFFRDQYLLLNRRYPGTPHLEGEAAATQAHQWGLQAKNNFNRSKEHHQRLNTFLLERIRKQMQGMIKGKSGRSQKGAEVGKHGRTAQEVSSFLDALASSQVFGNGLGMYGATDDDMDVLIDMMSQYLENRNIAARLGGASAGYDQLKKPTYTVGDSEYVYNYYKHMGPYRLSPDVYQDNTNYEGKTHNKDKDPTFAMMDDFLREADNYVVLQGKNGVPIQPLLEWSGLEQRGPNFKWMPLRVDMIRMKGTSVEKSRQLKRQLTSYGILVDTPWEYELIGKRDPKATTKIGKQEDPKVSAVRKARWNPEADTNNDGVVDNKDKK
tara:strand:- start:6888 stop:9038 length:2151 start_codon:yes stop_codon:yes gene_type:complete